MTCPISVVSIGKAVRLFRELRGLNIQSLATMSELDLKILYRIENGLDYSLMELDEWLTNITRMLEIDIKDILDVANEIEDPNSTVHEGMAAWDRLKDVLSDRYDLDGGGYRIA